MEMSERETIVTWNDAEKSASVYTASYTYMQRMDRLCREHPENYKCTETVMDGDKVSGKFYSIADKKLISLRGRMPQMTEEQKEANAARIRKYSFKKREAL